MKKILTFFICIIATGNVWAERWKMDGNCARDWRNNQKRVFICGTTAPEECAGKKTKNADHTLYASSGECVHYDIDSKGSRDDEVVKICCCNGVWTEATVTTENNPTANIYKTENFPTTAQESNKVQLRQWYNKYPQTENQLEGGGVCFYEKSKKSNDYIEYDLKPYDITTNSNYYYMIRETGGIVTGAYVDNRNDKILSNPYTKSNVGTEAYLLELGYLSNKNDLNNMINNINIEIPTANIGNIANTSSLINWILSDERAEGEFSAITECGNNDNFIVAVVTGINPKGYLPLKKVSSVITNRLTVDKKAEMITAELAGKDFAAISSNNKVKTCTVDMVEYKKATHIPTVNADEPVISAVVANMNVNEVSAPIKGNNGVYVVKVTAKNAKNGEFNAETENMYITSNGGMFSYDNIAPQLFQMAIDNIYPVENKLHTMQMAQ